MNWTESMIRFGANGAINAEMYGYKAIAKIKAFLSKNVLLCPSFPSQD